MKNILRKPLKDIVINNGFQKDKTFLEHIFNKIYFVSIHTKLYLNQLISFNK